MIIDDIGDDDDDDNDNGDGGGDGVVCIVSYNHD